MNTEFEFSAGGIVRTGGDILLIKTKNLRQEEVWTFPKGKIEKGEISREAAVREVLEETGYDSIVDTQAGRTGYIFHRKGKTVIKRVYWFLMTSAGKKGKQGKNISEIRWSPYDEAVKLLSYPSDKQLLDKIFKG
ncbi:MAG: NUDIX hydrolase [Elusimicrobiota bacterium]